MGIQPYIEALFAAEQERIITAIPIMRSCCRAIYLTLQKLEKDKKPWSVRVCVRNGYTVGVQVFIKRAIKLSPNLNPCRGKVRSVVSASTNNK